MSSSLPILAAVLLLQAAGVTQEKVTGVEAAKLAFPGCEIAREELTLATAEIEAMKQRAAVRAMPVKVVRFVARREGKVAGAAYIDTRRVRTKAQQLLVVLDAAGKVRRIEVLEWQEPQRYMPKARFFEQFRGKKLDATLRLRRGIRPITGATMSARATVDAVRTVLAVHERRTVK